VLLSRFNHFSEEEKIMNVDLSTFENMSDFTTKTGGGVPSFEPDEIRVGISYKAKASNAASVILGTEVASTLNWRAGDKIAILFNGKFLYIRRDNTGLWRLRADTASKSPRLMTTFAVVAGQHKGRQTSLSRHSVDYKIVKDGVVLEW
jgi:hypothetical protein